MTLIFLYHTVAPITNTMPLLIISFRLVQRALSLDINKAYEPEGIPPRVLKEYASELAPVLVRLFCFCLKTKTFPSFWKHELPQPSSEADQFNPSDYHPDALASTISKVLESFLNSHFLKDFESNTLL